VKYIPGFRARGLYEAGTEPELSEDRTQFRHGLQGRNRSLRRSRFVAANVLSDSSLFEKIGRNLAMEAVSTGHYEIQPNTFSEESLELSAAMSGGVQGGVRRRSFCF
jgi:hypothetical protein